MKLINSNRYYLPGQTRFIHIATCIDGLKEYICMIDTKTQQCYIEELTYRGLEFIEDDNIVKDIQGLLESKHLLDMKQGLVLEPDKRND